MATHLGTWLGGVGTTGLSDFKAGIELYLSSEDNNYQYVYVRTFIYVTRGDFGGTTVTLDTSHNGSYTTKMYSAESWPGVKDSSIISLARGSTINMSNYAHYTSGSGAVRKSTASGSYTAPRLTFTITYNANGGSGAPSSQSYTYASSGTTNLSSTIPTRTGYTFLGWSLSSTATTASYSAGQYWSLSNGANYTLYAVWQINTYTITYNANGGTGAPDSQTYTYASSGTIALSSTIPIRTGHTFLGWSTSSTATSATYSASGSFNKNTTSNTTLYAVWKTNTYTITYNANGGSGVPSNQTYTYASSGTVSLSSTKPTRTDYEFLGWATSSTATSVEYAAGASFSKSVTSDTTLYAVWKLDKWCYLKYDANGGSCSIPDQQHPSGGVSIISDVKPIRSGYNFSGWSLSNDTKKATYLSGGKYVNDNFSNNDIVTLYAVWRKIINIYFRHYDEG